MRVTTSGLVGWPLCLLRHGAVLPRLSSSALGVLGKQHTRWNMPPLVSLLSRATFLFDQGPNHRTPFNLSPSLPVSFQNTERLGVRVQHRLLSFLRESVYIRYFLAFLLPHWLVPLSSSACLLNWRGVWLYILAPIHVSCCRDRLGSLNQSIPCVCLLFLFIFSQVCLSYIWKTPHLYLVPVSHGQKLILSKIPT